MRRVVTHGNKAHSITKYTSTSLKCLTRHPRNKAWRSNRKLLTKLNSLKQYALTSIKYFCILNPFPCSHFQIFICTLAHRDGSLIRMVTLPSCFALKKNTPYDVHDCILYNLVNIRPALNIPSPTFFLKYTNPKLRNYRLRVCWLIRFHQRHVRCFTGSHALIATLVRTDEWFMPYRWELRMDAGIANAMAQIGPPNYK